MCQPVVNTNGTLAAWLKSRVEDSGMGTALSAGTAISSQLPPSTALPSTLNARHWFCNPATHFTQCPQKCIGASRTRWPGLNPETYSPTSTISPAISLPRICGSFTPGSPLRTHKSK